MMFSEAILGAQTQAQSFLRRILLSLGVTEGSNSISSLGSRVYNFISDRVGQRRVKYILFSSLMTLFLLYTLTIHHYEQSILLAPRSTIGSSSTRSIYGKHSTNSSSLINHGNNPTNVIPSGESTVAKSVDTTHASSSGLHSGSPNNAKLSGNEKITFWVSILLSFFTWLLLMQMFRCIRLLMLSRRSHSDALRSSTTARNRNTTIAMLQLMMMNRAITQGSLNPAQAGLESLATRLRLAMLQRDFTGDDYEMLQQLDEVRFGGMGSAVRNRGATEQGIQRLPVHTVTQEEVAQQDQARGDVIVESTFNSTVSTNPDIESVSSDQRCAICLGSYCVGEEVKTLLCLHKFHSQCIDPWLRSNAVCPICKYRATDD